MPFTPDPEEFTGCIKNLLKALGDYPAEFTAGEINVLGVTAKLNGIDTAHGAKKQARDNDKIKLAGSQSAYEASGRNNYKAFSDLVDLMAGAVGKSTPLGQHILNQRKNLTGSNQHHAGSSSSTPHSSSSCSCSCSCSSSSSCSCSCSCSCSSSS